MNDKTNDFFSEYLSGLCLDFDESTLIAPNKNGEKEKCIIEKSEYEIKKDNLVGFAKSNSISINELILASLTLTLNKFNFSNETLIFNQNNVPFAAKFENRQISIREFLEKIHENYIKTLEFDEYFDKDDLPLNPEFYFTFDEDLKSDAEYSNYLSIVENDETVSLFLSYNDELYTKEFINLFISSLEKILEEIATSDIDKTNICDIAIVGENEDLIFTEVEMPLIHRRFEKQAVEKGDEIALVASDATLTYKQLDEKANVIANALIAKGVKPKSNVLVMLSRDSNLIASILGILKAGCAFIPIDPEYPQERINYIYENSQADYIIANESGEKSLDIEELLKDGNSDDPELDVDPDDLAYMIYTSGSTGNPKGVMISHKNICNQASNPKSTYESLLCITTISFDVSVDDILTSLSNGLKLVLADDVQIKNIPALIKLIDENKPEILEITPSRMGSYLEVKEFCNVISCFKCIFIGGEKFSSKVYEDLRKYSDAVVYNSYGPTETTITSNNKAVTDVNDLTVGLPHINYVTDVRDIDGKLVPDGVMGELYIGGTGVGKGYYNMPEKTAEVFLTINNIPYYRSGDYAIKLPNGEIDIKGRIDNQIKLRGLRIEIGEIESNVGKYPNIKQAVVVIKEINDNEHLCAYYTADEEIDSDDLKEFLKDRLTRYMVPTVFMQLDEMPQTPNGKTDLKQLPVPQLKLSFTLPESETEIILHEIASSISKTKEFGTTDDLYAIGFTSLTLMKLNARIYEEMGVNLDIISLLNDPTIKNIAKEIENNDILDLNGVIESSKDMVYYPLTENQMGIYYECIQSGELAQYNLPSVIRFGSEIDADRLHDAIIKTIEAYPYLKTRIVLEKGKVMLKRDDSIDIDDIPIINVDSISDEQIEKENLKLFDLHNDQLFRFKIYKTPSETILFSDVHHIISDGESLDKLFTNISNAYQGIEIEKETINGYINSIIESENENSEKYELSRKFFQDKLTQEIDSTVLTPNLNGNFEEGILKSISKNIDSELVNRFCSENRITPNVLFMAVTMLNLNKYTFNDKTLITTIFNGRSNSSYINTQALLVKTLPIVSINDDRTLSFKEYLSSVNDIWMETINHSDYPYTKISEEFGLKPEFFYAYNNLDAEEIAIDGKTYKVKYLKSLEVNYKISLEVNETWDNIELFLEYNDQLYSADYIDTFLNCIIDVINQLIESDIEELSIGEIELGKGIETPLSFTPVDMPILHKRFEKQVTDKGDETALVASDATLTYRQLDEKANVIANALIKRGVKPKSNVLVMLSRDSNLIASILGILKAGCAFIPIDPEYPQERINYIYENSQADYIIANESGEKSLDIEELLKEGDFENPDVDVGPDDLVYMIYTSGSTGNPKGVMISHENICNQVSNPKSSYDSLLCITTISFDVSVDDILTSLSNGLKLILADDVQIKNIPALIRLIDENKPEILDSTPSRLASYLEVKEFCNVISCLKCIFIGGEKFSAKVYEDLRKYSDAVVYNSYGPTETTITSNNKAVTDVNDLTVGLPHINYVTDVRDIDGKLLPNGVMGELYIGGTGVGKGYYNLPEKTQEVFLTIDGIPYYRSGDYAIQLPNGEIDIKGRIDNQIKLRGLRIEIGEIETNIGQYPDIRQAVVVIKEINNNDHLCAYYTADEEIDTENLKEFLKDRLTRYMVPTVFMQLDEMPQTPNGKTDLKQLPEPQLKLALVMPESETEERLYDIVSSLVDADEFGITDDLYAIGFTSLTLMKLNSIVYEQMGANLDISILFNEPTVKNFAIEIDNSFEKDSGLEELIESAKGLEYYPLTENQLGIYYECMQNPDVIKYTMPTTVRFDSDLDANRLKQAVIDTIEAHPYIKTRIVNNDGELRQKRCDDVAIDDIEIVKVDSISDEDIVRNDVGPISIEDSQLFKFKIYETPDEIVLFSDFHHIITDGVSQNNLFRDIADIYENREISEEIIDGYIYSLLEKEAENSEIYQSAEAFFDDKLTQGIESTVLTPDLNGNPDEGKIKNLSYAFDSELINEFCNDNSISKNALFMAGTILNLNKFTFSDKTLITTIFNGRSSPSYFNTQGFLVKTVPFIINNENRQASLRDFIKSIDQSWKDTLTNSAYPYIKIAEKYQLKPEFFYAYHEFLESDEMMINGKEYIPQELAGVDMVTVESKINLAVYDNGDEFNLILEYNDQLYSEDYVKTFIESLKSILVQFLENDMDNYRICDVKLKDDEEVHEFVDVEIPFIHKRFEKQVDEAPEKIALIASDGSWTYGELNQKANRVANALINKGIKANSNVLVMLPRDSNLISAILGVLKAGCAFIPIDINYPRGRIDYIFENSQADYLIADRGIENSIDINELLQEENASNPQVEIDPDDLAYMIYTSGSTGNPKGVMTSHMNITNLFSKDEGSVIYNAYSKMKRTLALSTVSFDAFLLDFMPLTFGLEVVLANDSEIKNIKELAELVKREKPDSLTFSAPSRFKQYLEYEEFAKQVPDFRYIGLGGEMVPQDLISRLLEYPNLELYNIYGPTETTVTCNTHKLSDAENITVGRALHNCITEVRDIDGKLVPNGVMGELYIGGKGVSRGYYNMEEKTKEVFLSINDIPYYRSGDYAIELPNGDLVIKGRIDNQIKLRGLRIELGEIESNIARFPHMKQIVVVIKEINNAEHLCAYFTADEEIDIKLLKRYLGNKLTEYMVPTVFMQLDEMPISPNGKTDIKRLPKPKLNLDYVEAEGETEEKLVELVSSIANTTNFGTTDNLYELGFSSLTLMKLNSMIFNEMNVNIDITSLFTNPTIKSLADKIDNNIEFEIDIDEIIETAKDMDYFPLTSNQMGIYYECMQTEKIKYTMPYAIRFESSIDPYKLKDAVIRTVDAHPYLKTRIINTDDGKILQKRCDDVEIEEIEIVEIDSISNRQIMDRDIKPIPLDDNQLLRFKIYKTPTETILFADFHHIITDGVSQGIFFNDLAKAYNNEEIEAEKIDGYEYSLIEEKISLSEVSENFFKKQFSQGIESTVLTPNMNGNPDIGNIKLISDQVGSSFVRHFCKDYSISPNVLFMGATLLCLNKFTFSGKSLITTIFNGRSNSNYDNTQGMLVKTLPIIVNAENRDMMVEDYIKLVDKAWKDALTHSNYPYTKLAEDYQLKPEFFYAFHESLKSKVELDGRTYEAIDLDGTVSTDYKINLDIFDDGEFITLYLEYNDQIYTEEYVNQFIRSIKYILFQFFVHDMDKLRIRDIELVEGEIPEFEEIDTPIIHKRFEKQVVEKPGDVALVASDATLTYGDLNEKSNRIANALIRRGVKPRSNILIMLKRDSNLIASILGVLKAGCAYVPIDPEYPSERINYIYENSQADYIISYETSENSLNVYELLEEEIVVNPNVEVLPDDLAYMIYTSGSTGNPKGVMISHKNICNQAQNPKSTYDSLLCITTISFDVSVDDILTSLSNGLKLILADDVQIKTLPELIKLIDENKPEALEITPSRIGSYLELEEFCNVISCLKCIFLGGEQFSAKVYEDLRKYSDAVVYNSYGPTETTITSNNKAVTDVNDLTVGPPLKNYVTDVRDIDGKLVPNGVMGELYIGGMSVGKGYYNMPEKTEKVFLTINGIPYYRSGDYAIQLPNGEIDIKGRIDNQIKLRGLRIEIGEIESNIGKYQDIRQAVVVIKEINNVDHLCAYYTANCEIDSDDLKEFLKDRLTNYMIPTVFVQLDEMPQTPNGKTDIKRLPQPKVELNYVAPKTRLEHEICAIFSSILNIETVGVEDNFFEIGGTSLIASKLIIELLKQGYSVRYDDIFRNKTPRALAKLLSGEDIGEEDLDLTDDIIKNYNYGEINELLQENTWENFFDGENLELGNVLLTGATGFLGIHILYEFIKSEEGKIYCMLRKGKFDSCQERLIDVMNDYFDEDFTDLVGSRIIPIEGDITEIDDFKQLEDEPIDTVINSAALVKHYTADDYIFRVNVDGVINGLKFAQTRNNIKYVQISTISVLSSYSLNEEAYPNQEYDERTLYYEQDLENKYVCSKFLAERAVLQAATKGLPVKIIRVGNLMSRYSDGVFQKNYDTNAFLNNIKTIKKLGAMNPAMASEKVDMSQIDYVAKGILALSKTPEKSRVFHCMNNHYISHRDIVDALNTYGYGIEEVDFEEFKQIYEQNMNENIQGIITADFSIDDFDEEDDFEENVEIEQTVDILHSLGFDWPEADEEYLKRLFDYLNKFDYFE
ncbi:non-ribosomal peptide synthetase [Methanobrevibacter ruminantium M1]|uniref:Non-ribosomal peptide synthetase n=1 Tax=Methanobrevibacter ruminantium (strain ATCC 35063 / DSM 1093 / JCM 13430 / OCM 146 / M1) TaxID=634498 RepID=D3E027_METRM|nr:non-ribosomal peptide synthetase [Methanobrevibacter ruminantium]ADC46203.1 non-ribosomal peptide synthetase [Methanobrevibacter ruminantium M1]